MNMFLALLSGVIVTLMLAMNGQLSDQFGLYLSTLIIHTVGFVTIFIVCVYKKFSINLKQGVPWYLYMGGVIGIFTVLFNNATIGAIGASLVSALGLLGQLGASIVLEHKGWLGSVRSAITKEKLLSLLIILVGIGVML